MEKFIAKTFTRWFYIQLPNKKFIKFESAFLYMLVACLILGYGVLNFTGLALLPFMIPFLFGGSVMFNGSSIPYWITKNKETGGFKFKHFKFSYYPFVTDETLGEIGAWRTQLRLLKTKLAWGEELSETQLTTIERLEQVFEIEHGVKHIDFKEAKITKFTPWLLFIFGVILALLA
jgi:hypothetical protein